jgi:hypothetical protein
LVRIGWLLSSIDLRRQLESLDVEALVARTKRAAGEFGTEPELQTGAWREQAFAGREGGI